MASTPTATLIDTVLRDHRDVAAHLDEGHVAAWAAVDGRLLELCRLRIARLLGCSDEVAVRTEGVDVDEATIAELATWPTSPRFDPAAQACLAFTEQFVIDVATLDDSTAFAVGEHLGAQGLADFVSALLVIEQRQRLRLAWERLGVE